MARGMVRVLQAALTAAVISFGPAFPALARGPESVAGLAAELSDAVVNIGTSRRVPEGLGMPFPDVPEGSPLEDLFNELNPNHGLGEDSLQEARSLGSGFLIAAEGLVVTNNHVIDGAQEVLVFLTDGTRLEAQVVGRDDKMDLAVLRVDAGRPLPFVQFGDSDAAQVGDWVMAIGNPFGLGGSVTLGIVSARNRDISAGPYDNFIQTDASINQGNSGGPLFDMNGTVVGINTAIIARGGSSLGIGFAVPANQARPVVEQLVAYGRTRRGWIGVGIQDVTDDIAATLSRPNTNGALVVEVTAGGPADGVLEDGDLILAFDGQPIRRMRDLPRLVALSGVGQARTVTVLRDGTQLELTVTLGQLEPDEAEIAALDAPAAPGFPSMPQEGEAMAMPGSESWLGLEVGPVTEAARAEFGIEQGVEGVLITDVAAGSDAETKGLIAGLVVTEANQRRVAQVEDLTDILEEAREAGRPAVLFKVTDPTGSSRFVAVRPR